MKDNKFLQFIDKNLANGLFITGAIGVGATVYFAIDDTIKALQAIQDAKDEKYAVTGESKLTPKELISVAAPCYKKTAVGLVVSETCLVTSHKEVNDQLKSASMAAEALTTMAFESQRYARRLEEEVGPKKLKEIREEEAIKTIKDIDISTVPDRRHLEVVGRGEELFYDSVQERWFMADREWVASAIKATYHAIVDHMQEGNLNILNSNLGVRHSEIANNIGYYAEDMEARKGDWLNPVKGGFIGCGPDLDGCPCWVLWYPVPTRLM